MLAGDREVTRLVLRPLLEPNYQSGAIVDGYPRTKTQVECLKLFHRRLTELRSKYLGTFQEAPERELLIFGSVLKDLGGGGAMDGSRSGPLHIKKHQTPQRLGQWPMGKGANGQWGNEARGQNGKGARGQRGKGAALTGVGLVQQAVTLGGSGWRLGRHALRYGRYVWCYGNGH